jgi:5'-nucleotidase (lipoprotein e(P4) family)
MKINNSPTARALWMGLAFVFFTGSSIATSQSNQPPADNAYIEGAVLWQQSSGERRALSYQAFTLARMMLDRDLRMNRRARKPRAIIVDLDETILDNSSYEGKLLKDRVNYPEGWTEWVNRAEATAVPGAVEFLDYAAARGVRVFYVTNRIPAEKEGTARNLKKLGFPRVDDESLLTSPGPRSASKEPRRNAVSAKYHVVLLMGDDLNDFAKVFEDSKTIESRIAASDRFKNEFGKRFIVLPNAMYGNWEQAIYEYNKLSDAEKASARKKLLQAY